MDVEILVQGEGRLENGAESGILPDPQQIDQSVVEVAVAERFQRPGTRRTGRSQSGHFLPQQGGEVFPLRGDGPSAATRAGDDLGPAETENREGPNTPQFPPSILSPQSLRRGPRSGRARGSSARAAEAVHRRSVAEQVNGKDRPGPGE